MSDEDIFELLQSNGVMLANSVPIGKDPHFPETFEDALLRYLLRFETAALFGIDTAENTILVTHADAVAGIITMLMDGCDVRSWRM